MVEVEDERHRGGSPQWIQSRGRSAHGLCADPQAYPPVIGPPDLPGVPLGAGVGQKVGGREVSSAANARPNGFDTSVRLAPGVVELIPLPEVNRQDLRAGRLDRAG